MEQKNLDALVAPELQLPPPKAMPAVTSCIYFRVAASPSDDGGEGEGRRWRRMPLVRLEVRNEYGLGDPELYRGAFRKEEPKAILDGVAVAGLVGILRQLGDLAE
ncbi:hypothetical protein BHE74_00001414 [Ensete ventricosum]|nr:hypothetical protein BHE74_00001414 [Ensete ventricosum]